MLGTLKLLSHNGDWRSSRQFSFYLRHNKSPKQQLSQIFLVFLETQCTRMLICLIDELTVKCKEYFIHYLLYTLNKILPFRYIYTLHLSPISLTCYNYKCIAIRCRRVAYHHFHKNTGHQSVLL